MSKNLLNNTWKKWYPTKIEKTVKHVVVNYQDELDSKNNRIINISQILSLQNISAINKIQENNGYQDGFQKGVKEGFISGQKKSMLEFERKNNLILNKMEKLLSDFKNSLLVFDKKISSEIISIVLKISKQVIESTSVKNDSILLKKINKIFQKNMFSLEHPKLFVNQNDRLLVENYFGKIFSQYNWIICVDDQVPLGGFIISLGDTIVNSTTSMRWNKLCQLIYSKEKNNELSHQKMAR